MSTKTRFISIATVSILLAAILFAVIQTSASGEVEVVKAFEDSPSHLPEGITIDKAGKIYVSLGPPFFVGGGFGAVWELSPDGTEASVLAEYPEGPAPAGLAVDPQGNVYFALPNLGQPGGGVFRLTDDGAELIPGTESMVVPNGLALDKGGDLFASDSVTGFIWRIPGGGTAPAEIWYQGEPTAGCPEDIGANGIAFWKGDLYVANTSKGTLVRIPVLPNGSPGEGEVIAGDPDCEAEGLFGMDGIAFDTHGNVYALLVMQNKVVRIDPSDGTTTTLLTEEDGLWNPASVAFGTGKGERKSIFITNYAVIEPPEDNLGPAVLKYDVGVPGLPLP
jgi:sugar lactone lactonase YvrE